MKKRSQPEQATKQIYRDVTRNGNNYQKSNIQSGPNYGQRERREQGNEQNRRRVVSWTCQVEGHISRNCSRRVTSCYACGVQGHIRRNCSNVRCRKYNKYGHGKKEC